MLDVQSDPETPESEKIIYESKSLVDSSLEVIDSQSSNLAGDTRCICHKCSCKVSTCVTRVIELNNDFVKSLLVYITSYSPS